MEFLPLGNLGHLTTFTHFSLLFPALDSESHIFCLFGVGKSMTDQCKMENVCLIITSWEIPCMNPVSYTQEWWLCSFSTNFLSCLSGQRTNSVLHQTYLECNKLLMKKKKRDETVVTLTAFRWWDCLNKLDIAWFQGCHSLRLQVVGYTQLVGGESNSKEVRLGLF